MKNIIIVMSIISSNLFFAVRGLVGLEYGGADKSNSYIVYSFIVAIALIVIVSRDFFLKKVYFLKSDLILLGGVPFCILINLLITKFLGGTITEFAFKYYFQYFILWSYMGIIAGVYICRKDSLREVSKLLDIVIVIYTLAVMRSSFMQLVQSENFMGIGGASYQGLSYIAAFTFGLNLNFILNGDKYKRLKFFKSKFYKKISIIFLLIQLASVLLSGGRGGSVLVGVYLIFNFVNTITFKGIKVKYLKLFCFFILITPLVLSFLLNNEIFKNGIRRVFAFIGENGIDWSGTSGRDIVYLENIAIIKENLLFGKGLFLTEINPHNLILEILINGGLVYLIAVIGIGMKILIKIRRIYREYEQIKLILVILIYPLTMLMFSGTYLTNSELWFCIAVICSFKLSKKKERCEEYETDRLFSSKYI